MKRIFNFLQSKSGINILFVFIFLFFLVFSLFRIGCIDKTFDFMAADFHNDWDYYAKHAKDIKENGVLMPGVNSNYVIPAGFFYNYFLAACIFVFGNNVSVIYVLQSLLLGGAIWIVFRLFSDQLKNEHKALFVFGLFVLACLDVYHYYTFLLLSENLGIITIPAFLLFLKRGIESGKNPFFIISGLFLAISLLTRPTLMPFCIFLALTLPFVWKRQLMSSVNILFFSGLFFLVFLLLPVRNYFVTGNFALLPVNGSFSEYMNIANPLSFSDAPVSFVGYYFKKVLFSLGFLPIVESVFQYRPHWMLMWLGYGLYLIHMFKRKPGFRILNFYIHFLILLFYAVIILVAPIQSYGFRMMVPVLFLVYGISFVGYTRTFDVLRLKSS